MNKYLEIKGKHEKEFEEFPMFFAFSEKQFEEGLKKLGCTKNDIYSLSGTGGFYRKSDSKKLNAMFDKWNKEIEEAIKDDEYVYQMFRYELGNHEYCITYDYEETLGTFGLEFKDLDKRMKRILLKAKEDYLKAVE